MLRRAHTSARLLVSFALAIVVLLVLLYQRHPLQEFAYDLSSDRSRDSEASAYLSTAALDPDPDAEPVPEAAHPDREGFVASHHPHVAADSDDAAHRLAVHRAKAHAGALSKRVIVASMKSEDTQWTQQELPAGWEAWVYVVDDARAALRPPSTNKGREAGVFLWYVVSQYDALAETNVFLHAHRAGYPQAWHVDNEAHSNPLSVRRLRLDTVQKNGYVNLRCRFVPGCPDDLQPFRQPVADQRPEERALRDAWPALFPDTPAVPSVIAVPCCSQFAVSREQVHRRPRSDYQRFYQWLQTTDLPDHVSGRVFEYLWHVIFGQDPVSCPPLDTCYCDVYGDGCLEGIL